MCAALYALLYNLLFDIDLFSDNSFLPEAIVLLLKSKISLINVVKLIDLNETGSVE